MRRRITALLAVAAIAALGLVAQAGPASSGAGGGPIGYTYVAQFVGSPQSCVFLAIDLSTGVAEQRNQESLPCADGLTFAPDGTLYGYRGEVTTGNAGAATLVRIDPATGAQTDIGPPLPRVFFGSGGMTFDAAGNLWLYAATTDEECELGASPWCLWQVDPTNAATTLVGQIDDLSGVFGLTGTCSGEVQAITRELNNGIPSGSALQAVDTSTAALTQIAPVADVFVPGGLDYDAAGGLWAIGSSPIAGIPGNIEVYAIDPATGSSTATTVLIEEDEIFGIPGGLAISPIGACPPPPPTPTPEVVVLQPTFTG